MADALARRDVAGAVLATLTSVPERAGDAALVPEFTSSLARD